MVFFYQISFAWDGGVPQTWSIAMEKDSIDAQKKQEEESVKPKKEKNEETATRRSVRIRQAMKKRDEEEKAIMQEKEKKKRQREQDVEERCEQMRQDIANKRLTLTQMAAREMVEQVIRQKEDDYFKAHGHYYQRPSWQGCWKQSLDLNLLCFSSKAFLTVVHLWIKVSSIPAGFPQ